MSAGAHVEPAREPAVSGEPRRLRVLSFTTLYPNPAKPLHGLFVKNRVERLSAHCDVDVVAPVNLSREPGLSRRIPLTERPGPLDVHHPRFWVVPGLFKQYDGDLLFRQAFRQMKRRLDLARYDVLDAHYAYPDGYACMRLARAMGKPWVLSLRGSDIRVLPEFPARRRRIEQALRAADAVVGVSRDLCNLAVDMGADRSRVHAIPNGVDREMFHPAERVEARRRLGWDTGARTLLAVGRLVPVKGYDLLIRAVAELRDRSEPVRCFIVGEGEERAALTRLIAELGVADWVSLPGRATPAELRDHYNAADVFCLTSHSEGCPNVALEAMACGTPVAGMDVGGIPEVIDPGRNGVLIPSREAGTVAESLLEVLGRDWDREAISRNEPVRGWEEVAEAQYRVLRSAAGV